MGVVAFRENATRRLIRYTFRPDTTKRAMPPAMASLVEVHYALKVHRLVYVIAKTAAGWRLHDIEYDSHASLAKMLKTPVK